MVNEERPKPSVEEKQPKSPQPGYAIPDNGYQGKASSDHTVLEEMEEARSESGDEQDPPTQNDNSQLGSPEREPTCRPKRQRHPPTLLTYNTFGNPTYETPAAAHAISTNSVLGSQLPQCCTPYLTWGAGFPVVQQFQLPTNPPLYQHPVVPYPGTYLQYPPVPHTVFQPVNQYSAHQPVVYQPKDDPMKVPVTVNSGHVPVPGYVY